MREQQDRKLFDLLGEHRQLVNGKPGSNWFDTFRDSVELKTLIKRDFGPIASKSELEALIASNQVPMIAVKVDTAPPQRGEMMIKIRLYNVGTVPAYRLLWNLDGGEHKGYEMPVLAPQQETYQGIVYGYDGQPWERIMRLSYYTPQGHCVRDEYTVGVRQISATVFGSGATATPRPIMWHLETCSRLSLSMKSSLSLL